MATHQRIAVPAKDGRLQFEAASTVDEDGVTGPEEQASGWLLDYPLCHYSISSAKPCSMHSLALNQESCFSRFLTFSSSSFPPLLSA